MQSTINQAIQAKLTLKQQLIQIDEIQSQIQAAKITNFSLAKKELFLLAQQYLLTQKSKICAEETASEVESLQQLRLKLTKIDENLAEILAKTGGNSMEEFGELELVRLLG
ncbi:hypothetical protein SS50377_27581 [Spironucleus salmonicida]|uniref:Uncharacterized protein n=1 Tax=Spironucleus salmonicida TaxID=348837 RepID=V6LPM7_9EUKA|nr:hypothetical protein SS50377_27581 [Spironucleus salmonicida]|eukprot:EST46642.1 Hypothetical protein SS50377_13445 [Spironucleus salmonicida]